MKNNLLKIALALVLPACLLLSLSCGDASQNKSVVTNSATNTANSAAIPTDSNSDRAAMLEEDCSGDATVKKNKITNGIEKSINLHNGLKYQYQKKFYFEPVVDANGDAVLYIWGRVFTSAKDINQLNNTYERFVRKGCVTKVVFGTAPELQSSSVNSGFEYDMCESPNQICSDGSCQASCSKTDGANSNTNPRGGVNSNTNANANTNAKP